MRTYLMASHKPGVRQTTRRMRVSTTPVVFIVEADDETRAALERVLAPVYDTRVFSSAAAFFAEHDPEVHGCIIIDSSPPAAEGFATLASLKEAECGQPVIFLSAGASIATTVRALRAGAINFLSKPVGRDVLLAAVDDALTLEADRREFLDRRREASKRLSALTPRERQVLGCLVSGMLNKQIAAELGIVENTVKAHRARIMQKLAVRSLAELVYLASTTDLDAARRVT
jgi:FixJ family two-component response regulator